MDAKSFNVTKHAAELEVVLSNVSEQAVIELLGALPLKEQKYFLVNGKKASVWLYEQGDASLSCTLKSMVETLVASKIETCTDLFETGLLDSLALVTLILDIESQFSIIVDYDALDIEMFRSINAITTFVLSLS